MSSEDGDGVSPLNCFPVSLPYGLAPHSKPNLTGPPITPKSCLLLSFGGGGGGCGVGHHDHCLISLWEEILYGTQQESILGPLIFTFRG